MTGADRPTPSRLLVTAAAGYGKSHLLEVLRPEGGVVTTALELVAEGLPEGAPWLGIDDVDQVGTDDLARLVDLLTGRDDVAVALASRAPMCGAVSAALGGRLSEWDSTDLALSPYAVARVLAKAPGVTNPEAALRVAELTAGWPTLVHFAADALARDVHADLVAALTATGAPAEVWIRSTVLAALPAGAQDLLRLLAEVDGSGPVTQAACDAVADASRLHRVPGVVEDMRRAGLLVPDRRVGRTSEVVLVPVVALVLRDAVDDRPSRRTAALAAALARVHEAQGAWLPAARAHVVAGDRTRAVRLVTERGGDMLRRGDAGAVARLVEQIGGEAPDDEPDLLRQTYADALRMSGDTCGTRRALAPLVARADAAGWRPGLAARVAGLHYLCGDFESALDVLSRCTDHPEPAADRRDGEDLVDWLACRVHVLAMLGRPDDARTVAAGCLEAAEGLGAARSLAVAHLAMARTCRGTLKELHHEHAVRYATEAGDAVTATRALAAQTCLLLAAARYDRAVVSARETARMARLACPPGLQAAALHNLGEALRRTGELDEALWHLECSVALCRRLGPARAALGLVGTAEVHRSLGHEEQSRTAYTEAVELARGSGDAQVLVQALSGLALVTAGEPTPQAEHAASEALALAPTDLLPIALTAAGRVALVRGNRAAATEHAVRAVAAARDVRAVDLLADALELEAAVVDDPARARGPLTEALSIWAAGGAGPAVARVEVLIGRLPDADGTERSRARGSARSLRRLGIHVVDGRPAARDGGGGTVSICVLGPFSVTVDGTAVPLPAWRSKQARTLLKILAAQRGRVVTRARLCDLLWPDDDPRRTGHRLSVLLATVRGVLDPEKAWPPDRYVAADQSGVRLALGAVTLDADLLVRDAAHATLLIEAGDAERAREVLAHVDELYRGEALEDESEEWADTLREEVRAAWVRSVRRLATLQAREGRGAEALGIFVRLLAIDPYDEQVHRRLVTSLVHAGRHGEARRALERWRRAMAEIDAPTPDLRAVDAALGVVRPGAVLTSR